MKRLMSVLVVMAFMLCMASVVFARGGPPGEKAFTSKAAVEQVTPFVATVPAQVGYDVIQNISTESRDLSIAQNTFDVDTSAQMGLSPTVDWQSTNAMSTSRTARSSPMITLKR